jgi:imidazoleglycerol phosphate dehydratase HisB
MTAVALERKTAETEVSATIASLERPDVDTSDPLLDHLLDSLALHWGLGLRLRAMELRPCGDRHHLWEDSAIVLGRLLEGLLGKRAGICRYGQRILPMDEALAQVAVDLARRAYASLDLGWGDTGNPPAGLVRHFMRTFAAEGVITLHARVTGEDPHHMSEALFKAVGLSLAEACAPWEGTSRSTKGGLD